MQAYQAFWWWNDAVSHQRSCAARSTTRSTSSAPLWAPQGSEATRWSQRSVVVAASCVLPAAQVVTPSALGSLHDAKVLPALNARSAGRAEHAGCSIESMAAFVQRRLPSGSRKQHWLGSRGFHATDWPAINAAGIRRWVDDRVQVSKQRPELLLQPRTRSLDGTILILFAGHSSSSSSSSSSLTSSTS